MDLDENGYGEAGDVACLPLPELSRYESETTILTFGSLQCASTDLQITETTDEPNTLQADEKGLAMRCKKTTDPKAEYDVVSRQIFDEPPPQRFAHSSGQNQGRQDGGRTQAVAPHHRPLLTEREVNNMFHRQYDVDDGRNRECMGRYPSMLFVSSDAQDAIHFPLRPCCTMRSTPHHCCGIPFNADSSRFQPPDFRLIALASNASDPDWPLGFMHPTAFPTTNVIGTTMALDGETNYRQKRSFNQNNEMLQSGEITSQRRRLNLWNDDVRHFHDAFQSRQFSSTNMQRTAGYLIRRRGGSLPIDVAPSMQQQWRNEISPWMNQGMVLCSSASLDNQHETEILSSDMNQAAEREQGIDGLSSLPARVMDWDVPLGYTREGTTGLRIWRKIRGARRRVEVSDVKALKLKHQQEIARLFAGSVANPKPMFLKQCQDQATATHVWIRTGGSCGAIVRRTFWRLAELSDIRKDINTKRSSKAKV